MKEPKSGTDLRGPKVSSETAPAEQARILLVDDQPARLLTYESILEPLGVECVRAHSGEEALARLLHESFALILLDVSMPGMDGFETARLIRHHPRFESTPIIFVTGVRVAELDRLKGYEVGAIDYISVPVVPEILRSKVAVLVELYRKRKEIDQQLSEIETLYRTAQIGLAMHDRDLRCVRMNDMIAQINGVSIEASVGRRVREFLPADLADKVEPMLRKVLETGEAVSGIEMQGQTAAGIPSSWLVSYHPMRDGHGAVVGVQAVVQDISARVRDMESARLARKEADRANEAKSRFLAYASHDLRQPLQVALLHLEELCARVDKPEERELADLIQQSFDAIMEILDALVDVSRLEQGNVSLQIRDVDIRKMVEEIIDEHKSQADQKGLRLTARSCESFVRTDPMLLKRVVDNFVSNAIRYTDAGEVTVHCDRDSSRLRISVEDTGKGIPADKLDTIFEEYVRLDNTARGGGKGLGLGLAIVKHIANLLGHRIEVTSSLGKGSTFCVEIPSQATRDR